MTVQTVVVLGAGTMGRGIAQVSAMAGFTTRLYDLAPEALQKAREQIETNLRKGLELGKITEEQCRAGLGCLQTGTDLDRFLAEADFVVEAVPEQIRLKLDTFERCEKIAPREAILASNTSSLSISEIAAATTRPDRVIGMHFFNPVHLMKLIEIVVATDTSRETVEITRAVAQRMGKQTVVVRESPGFITTRINALIGNEAFYMLAEGIASAEDIDTACKLGLNHPMGPFELVDLVGLDTRLSILQFLHERLGEKYRPCPLLEHLVRHGRLGRKVGKGVYEY